MTTPDNASKTVYIGARIPLELQQRFARLADSEDRSVSGQLRRLIQEHVDRAEEKTAA